MTRTQNSDILKQKSWNYTGPKTLTFFKTNMDNVSLDKWVSPLEEVSNVP